MFRVVLAGLLLLLVRPVVAEKIWTNAASGLWQDGTNWSGHTAPDVNAFIRITNALSKTITVNAATPSTNLTAQMLTLSAPPGSTNTLLLSGLGLGNPLVFQTGLELMDGAHLRITNSELQLQLTNDHVNLDGALTLDSGLIDFGDITVTARVGRVTSGVFTINGGTVSAGAITVGGLTNSTGALVQNGGTLNVASFLSIGRNVGTTGVVSILGGELNVTNDDTRVGDGDFGQMVVTNAQLSLNNLQVARNANGILLLQTGGVVQVSLDTALGRFAGATGLVSVAGGQLVCAQKLYVARGGTGKLDVSAGALEAASLLVAADTTNSVGAQGVVNVTGGSLLLSSNLFVGSASFATGQVAVTAGLLAVTNPGGTAALVVSSGALVENGGTVLVDSLLVTNSSGEFRLLSGTVSTKGTTVGNGAPFVVGDGVSRATLNLHGGVHTFAGGLVISSNGTLTGCGTVVGGIINHGTIATNCGGAVVPPSLTGVMQNETVVQGGTAQFTVSASGTQPLSYQWQFDGSPLAGATGSSLVATNVQMTNAGSYTVVVTNLAGQVSSTATLIVVALTAPDLTLQTTAGTSEALSFMSQAGVTYTLQYKNQLSDASWTDLPPSTNGTGSPITLRDATGTVPMRFYRISAK